MSDGVLDYELMSSLIKQAGEDASKEEVKEIVEQIQKSPSDHQVNGTLKRLVAALSFMNLHSTTVEQYNENRDQVAVYWRHLKRILAKHEENSDHPEPTPVTPDMMVHDTCASWRHTWRFYAALAAVLVIGLLVGYMSRTSPSQVKADSALQGEIFNLKKELEAERQKPKGGYTPEQVSAEVEKALASYREVLAAKGCKFAAPVDKK